MAVETVALADWRPRTQLMAVTPPEWDGRPSPVRIEFDRSQPHRATVGGPPRDERLVHAGIGARRV